MNAIEQAEQEFVLLAGQASPNQEWLLSDRDVWYQNPYYTGKPGPHPEDPPEMWGDFTTGEISRCRERDIRKERRTKEGEKRKFYQRMEEDDIPF